MYKYIVAAIIIGDEAKALIRVEPLNCTLIHAGTS